MATEVTDQFITLIGGMNGGVDPMVLPDGQYARGVNITSRGGLAKTRPGFKKILDLNMFVEDFKGAGVYKLSSKDRIVYGHGTDIKSIDLESSTLSRTTHATTFSEYSKRYHFAQIHKYFVVQDGYSASTWETTSWPLILEEDSEYDQSAIRNGANPERAFPKGFSMAYGQGRAFVTIEYAWTGDDGWVKVPRTNFEAGDIVKSHRESDVLSFTEAREGTGGAISVVNELGLITGMGFQKASSGTGDGPLIVFCQHGGVSYGVDLPRVNNDDAGVGDTMQSWANSAFGRVLFQTGGTRAENTIASVNNDLVYRATDGIRTVRYSSALAQSEGSTLSNTSISREVDEFLDGDDFDSQEYASAAFADNRYAVTTKKSSENGDWNGIVILDSSPVSMMTSSSTPIYDGIWTGLRFMQVMSARYQDKEQLMFIASTNGGRVGLYVLQDEDLDEENSIVPQSRVYTKYFHFGSAFVMKSLLHTDIWLEDIHGDLTVSVYYRGDGVKFWKKSGDASLTSDRNVEVAGGRVRKFRIYPSETECSPDSLPGDAHSFFSCQFCIEIKGICKMSKVQFTATPLTQDVYVDGCDGVVDVTPVASSTSGFLTLDDYGYKI